MAQQPLAGAAAACRRSDVQIFQIQAGFTQPGGIAEEIYRVANGLAVLQADQAFGTGRVTKQRLFDIGHAGDHFLLRFLIDGQLTDVMQDQRGISAGGRTNLYAHKQLLVSAGQPASIWHVQ